MNGLSELTKAVLAASDAMTRADKHYWPALKARCPCAPQHRREFRAARDAYRKALAAVRRAIADHYGWSVARTLFDVSKLTGGRCEHTLGVVDHVDCFRVGVRPYRRPAGIVTHSYRSADAIKAWADEHGLACDLLPESWYSRLTTAAVLYPKADR